MRQFLQTARRRQPMTLCLLATLALALIASTSPTSAAPREHLIEPAVADQFGYTLNWSYAVAIAPGNRINSVTVLGDLLLIVEQPRNVITAISLDSGQRRWKAQLRQTNSPLYEPARVGDTIVINATSQAFLLDAQRGRLEAQFDLPHIVRSGPAVAGRYGFWGGGTDVVFAVDLATGAVLWRNHTGAPVVTAPVLVDDRAIVGTLEGRYSAYNLQSGERLWTRHAFDGIDAGLVTDGQTIFIPSRDFSMYMAHPERGQDRFQPFRTESPLTEPPTLLNETLYLPIPQRALTAIDTTTGHQRWLLDEPVKPITTTSRGHLIAGLGHELVMVNAENGRVVSRASTTQRLHTAVAGPDHSVILVSPEGRILRINPRR